jgi:hypothetical protein
VHPATGSTDADESRPPGEVRTRVEVLVEGRAASWVEGWGWWMLAEREALPRQSALPTEDHDSALALQAGPGTGEAAPRASRVVTGQETECLAGPCHGRRGTPTQTNMPPAAAPADVTMMAAGRALP